jgi:hypothetical protein
VVADLLRELNYSLQANRKTREGTHNPDRDAQFGYINAQVAAALAAGEPAISVDTKKKERLNFTGSFVSSSLLGWTAPRHRVTKLGLCITKPGAGHDPV